MYINNHTEVWGSWYDTTTGQWGYACCHSSMHISYCTGQAGIEAALASSAQNLLVTSSSTQVDADTAKLDATTASTKNSGSIDDRRKKADELFSKKRLGEGDVQIDESRLAEAVREERERKRKGRDEEEDKWGKKQKKKGDTAEVTEEELGVFRFYLYLVFLLTIEQRRTV